MNANSIIATDPNLDWMDQEVVNSILSDLVIDYPIHHTKKLAIITTGAGGQWGSLITIPGASKVVHDIYIPYATEAFEALKTDTTEKISSVSVEGCKILQDSLQAKWGDTVTKVVCTGGLITNRFRRSDDQAYLAIDDEVYRVKFDKMTEDEYNAIDNLTAHRTKQDIFVMYTLWRLLVTNSREYVVTMCGLYRGVTVERIA